MYSPDGYKKKQTEWNKIFSDVANENQKTIPKYLEIPKINKFVNMNDDRAIDYLH